MNRIAILMLVGVLMVSALVAQPKGTLSVRYAEYGISVPTTLSADADLVPFIAGRVDSLPKKAAQSRFGILYREYARSLGAAAILEIVDAASGKTLKKVTLDEYFGKENASWKVLAAESKSNGTSVTTVFQVQTKEFSGKLIREVRLADDAMLPGGKSIVMTWSVESAAARAVSVRFFGRAEGVFASFANGFSILNNEQETVIRPAIGVYVQPAFHLQAETAKKGKPQTFTLTTEQTPVAAGARTVVLSLTVAGTSIRHKEYGRNQAENLVRYLATGKTAPNMIQYITTGREATSIGDTMVYTIHAFNIGTAAALNVVIDNPVPAGSEYVEGSATGTGTEITFARTQVAPPAQSKVAVITWKFTQEIKRGEERWVQYKVVVR